MNTRQSSGLNRTKRRNNQERSPALLSPEFRRMVDRRYRDFFESRNMPMPDGTCHYGAARKYESRKAREVK